MKFSLPRVRSRVHFFMLPKFHIGMGLSQKIAEALCVLENLAED